VFSLINASVFVYYPINVSINFVNPPIIFSPVFAPNLSTVLGSNRTSANVNVTLNKVLHIYDHDYSGRYVASRNYGSVKIANFSGFSIQLDVIEVANYSYSGSSDPGLVLLEVELFNGSRHVWISFYYWEGNNISVTCSNTLYPFNPRVTHTLNITITDIKNKKQPYNMYMDGNLICSGDPGLKITGGQLDNILVNVGRYDTANEYDLYIDNVKSVLNNNVIQEDFEDWSDNFFNNSYGSGNVGKEVVARSIFTKFLFANVLSGIYNTYLNASSVDVVSGSISSSIWLNNTSPIKIINNGLVVSSTSELAVSSGNSITFYINGTSRISGSMLRVRLRFIYHVGDGVTVFYPILLTIKS